MDQTTEVTPGDDQSEQLAAYIARYLKRGIAVDTIRKGLEHNDWTGQDFDQAVSAARKLIETEEAQARAEKAEEEAKRAKRAKRRKRTEHKEERREPAGRKKERRDTDEDDEAESSIGAASFSQDEAILLHEPPKPKTDHTATMLDDEDLEAPVGLADLTADTEIPLSRAAARHNGDAADEAPVNFDANELLRQLTGQTGEAPSPDAAQPPYPATGNQPSNPYTMPWQQPMAGPYPYGYPYPQTPGWQPGAAGQAGAAVPLQAGPYPPNQPGPYPAGPVGPYAYPYPMPGQAAWPAPGSMAGPGGYPYPAPYGYTNQNPYGNISPQSWAPAGYAPYPAGPAVVSGTGFPAAAAPGTPPAVNRRTAAAGATPNDHYSLIQALKDGYQAAANNIVNYVLSIVLSGIAAGALFILALVVTHKLFSLKYNLLLIAPRKIFIAAFGSLTIYALFYILAGTLVITLTSLALSDGGLKRKRPINALILRSIALSGRVGSALIVSGAIIFLPAVLLIIIPVLILASMHALTLMAQLLPFLYGAAFIWVLMSGMRYALTPYVALFGRDTRISGMLSRSHALLGGSGQWLVAQLILILTITALGISLGSGRGWRQAVSVDNPALLITISILLLIASGVLVMLYRNQKLIRGRG